VPIWPKADEANHLRVGLAAERAAVDHEQGRAVFAGQGQRGERRVARASYAAREDESVAIAVAHDAQRMYRRCLGVLVVEVKQRNAGEGVRRRGRRAVGGNGCTVARCHGAVRRDAVCGVECE
jgi:hypothetical protein